MSLKSWLVHEHILRFVCMSLETRNRQSFGAVVHSLVNKEQCSGRSAGRYPPWFEPDFLLVSRWHLQRIRRPVVWTVRFLSLRESDRRGRGSAVQSRP